LSDQNSDLRLHRNDRFNRIVRHYRERYEALSNEGVAHYCLTALGAWATSRAPHVYYFFRIIDLSKYKLFVDLGSGDGIVTCIAGLFTRAIGIETDLELCRVAQNASSKLNLDDTVSFTCGDYLTQRIWKADCLYLYPEKPFHSLEKYLTNWQGTLLVYGPHLPPRRFVPIQKLQCAKERLVLYQNPVF